MSNVSQYFTQLVKWRVMSDRDVNPLFFLHNLQLAIWRVVAKVV